MKYKIINHCPKFCFLSNAHQDYMLMTIKQPCGAFIQKQGHDQCLQGLNGYRFNIKCQFGSVCPRVCVCVLE